MSRLTAIELTRWRAFERKQRIELRPITLFFGWNNTGKSALLRALPLIADSARPDAAAPLNLKGAVARGATFRDVSWRGERNGLSIALEWEGEVPPRYEVELLIDDDPPKQPVMRVKRFSWRGERGDQIEGVWNLTDANGHGSGFDLSGTTTAAATLRFTGLRPRGQDEAVNDLLLGAVRHIEALDDAVQWLASVRAVPYGPVRVQEGVSAHIEPDGRDVLDVLQQSPTVLARVNDWLEAHAQRSLELKNVSPGYVQPELRHVASGHAQRLADHGEGILQVLPVLAAIERARSGFGDLQIAPRIVAVEDPESHLHPHLQHALAQKIASVAMDDDPPTMVLETHSQHLLLAVQLAVAQGVDGRRLDPSRVAIYWVEQDAEGVSEATPVRIDSNGDLHDWPPDVYSDVVDMARELTAHRWGLRR
jgi:predicted ATPase